MRILVDNSGYELRNFGDISMLQIAIARLAQLWPGARLDVLTLEPELLRQLCPAATPLLATGRRAFFADGAWLPGSPAKLRRALDESQRHLRRHFPHLGQRMARRRTLQNQIVNGSANEHGHSTAQFLQAFRAADMVIGTGGGYLNDSFPEHAQAMLDTLWMAQRAGKMTALLGQGIGPLQGRRVQRNARQVLAATDLIALREKLTSLPLCRDLNLAPERVFVTGDDAIETAYELRRNDELGAAIGVNLRVSYYSRIDETMLQTVRAALQTQARAHDAALIGTPISVYEEESDLRSIDRVLDGLTAAACDDASRGREVTTPDQAIAQIGRCRIVVTGSYHAGVFALSQGIGVVGVAASQYYVDKFAGLRDQFGAACHVVALDHHDSATQLQTAIAAAWRDAFEVREPLFAAARQQIAAGQNAYRTLHELATARGLN